MVALEFNYTLEDAQEAYREMRKRRWAKNAGKRLIILALLLACVALLFWMNPNDPIGWALLGGIIVFGLSLAMAWIAYGTLAKRTWNSNPVFKQRFKVEINGDRINTDCGIASSCRKWECATGAYETENLFVINYGDSQTQWFPKRVMSAELMAELRELLQTKFPAKA